MPGWLLPAGHVQVTPASEVEALFSLTSLPVHLSEQYQGPPAATPSQAATPGDGAAASEDTPVTLRRGQGRVLLTQASDSQSSLAGASSSQAKAQPVQHPIDCLMYTGGLVWSAAFCPLGSDADDVSSGQQNGQPLPKKQQQQAQQSTKSRGGSEGPPPNKRSKATSAQPQPASQQGAGTGQQGEAQADTQTSSACKGRRWPCGARAWRAGGDLCRRTELLALAVHPSDSSRNQLGAKQTGLGAVQMWAVPSGLQSTVCPEGRPMCMFALTHQGKMTWDLQWCPEPWLLLDPSTSTSAPPSSDAAPPTHLPAMGVLALVAGDGSVQVLVVPDPTHPWLKGQLQAACTPDGQPSAIAAAGAAADSSSSGVAAGSSKGAAGAVGENADGASAGGGAGCMAGLVIEPSVVLHADRLGGGAASCVAWRPRTPGLLVGSWDGSVSVWQLPGTSSDPLARLTPLTYIRADGAPVRRVLWHPPSDPSAQASAPAGAAPSQGHPDEGGPGPGCTSVLMSLDESARHQFATCSQSGHMRIWDDRDMSRPLYDRLFSRTAMYDAVWVSVPGRLCIMGVLDDGSMRQLELLAGHHINQNEKSNAMTVMMGLDPACLWSISFCPELCVVAVAGEDGLVAVGSCDSVADHRMRRPHVPLGGIVSDRGVLRVVGPRELAGLPCVFRGNMVTASSKAGSRGNNRTAQGVISELRDSVQTLYTVAWSPNATWSKAHGELHTPATWLAYGGLAGFVRCMRVGAEQGSI